MVNFKLKSWRAAMPDCTDNAAWAAFAQHDCVLDFAQSQDSIKQIPALLRRRFNTTGRCVIAATLPLLANEPPMPCVYVSRHGDTALSLKLQQQLAADEPISPTDFSLAVHNAISGLLSIARKDVSAVTSIAATRNLLMQGLMESYGLLQEHPQVLCILADAPLPELHQNACQPIPAPFSIALVLSRDEGVQFALAELNAFITAKNQDTDEASLLLAFLTTELQQT